MGAAMERLAVHDADQRVAAMLSQPRD
jgi:hypothetical protein